MEFFVLQTLSTLATTDICIHILGIVNTSLLIIFRDKYQRAVRRIGRFKKFFLV